MTESGFSKAQSNNLPRLDQFMVARFFANNELFSSAEIRGVKLDRASRDSYGDSAIGYVQVKREESICIVKGEICPEHTLNVTLEVDRNAEEFQSVLCHDCAAALGIIGAIDGCNIKIKPPKHQHDSYIDRNANYSVKLQAVATVNKVITNINVGMPGSVHDIRMFRNSSLHQEITINGNKSKYFPRDFYHLIGDKAYPLLPWLMTPFKDYGNLTQRRKRYNKSLSRARIIIEHVFGWLKTRWRILKYINTNSIAKTVKIIVACCVLHNFCILRADLWKDNEEEEDEAVQDEEIQEGENHQASNVKRNQIEILF